MLACSGGPVEWFTDQLTWNKSGYTATSVACEQAVEEKMKVARAFGQHYAS